jgi:hypothetical protein
VEADAGTAVAAHNNAVLHRAAQTFLKPFFIKIPPVKNSYFV